MLKAILLLILTATANWATTLLFQGVLPSDDTVEFIQFALSSDSVVTLQSYGYAGGTANSTTIGGGGFAPFAVIFAVVGSDFVQALTDNGGHCGQTYSDPVTGNCDDPYIQTPLPAGIYYLGLSVWDNVPSTGNLADGYAQTGNPGFSCAEGGVSGQFCDVTDALFRSRTGNWAFAVSGVDSAIDITAPEPATWGCFAVGLGSVLFLLRRKKIER